MCFLFVILIWGSSCKRERTVCVDQSAGEKAKPLSSLSFLFGKTSNSRTVSYLSLTRESVRSIVLHKDRLEIAIPANSLFCSMGVETDEPG